MLVKVKVTPHAKKESLEEFSDGSFEVNVTEKAEMNQANIRTRELVAAHLGLAKANVRIISGHRSSSKLLEIKE